MFDAHFHLDQYPHPDRIARVLKNHGVVAVTMTSLPTHFGLIRSKFGAEKSLRFALGAHPLHAAEISDHEWRAFQRFFSGTTFIGEVGLDFSRDGIQTRMLQERNFRRVLQMTKGGGKILSIHSRRAEEAIFNALEECESPPALFHWYSGPLKVLTRIIMAGHYFSVNPSMISGVHGREIIKRIPQERVLAETDGPFVRIDGRVATPLDVERVYRYLRTLWCKPLPDVKALVRQNFFDLLHKVRADPQVPSWLQNPS